MYNNKIISSFVPAFDEKVIYCNRSESTWSSLCDMDPFRISDESLRIIHFEFIRNSNILSLILPLIGVFYLLGSVFALDMVAPPNQITNRILIFVGVYALIFTLGLPQIVKDMKPNPEPTIADSLINLSVVAGIAFTLSSILGPGLTKKTWIADLAGFLFVVAVFTQSMRSFPLDVAIWLVPVITFGLGCGLIIRIARHAIENVLSFTPNSH